MLLNRPPGRYSTPRPWQPLSDDELVALWPFFVHKGSGRPIFDIRARLDAIFWVACHNCARRRKSRPLERRRYAAAGGVKPVQW